MLVRKLFTVAILAFGMAAAPAQACRMVAQRDLADLKYADLVVVGRITNYRIIRDEAFRREMLANPNLTPDMRKPYEGPGGLISDYARFDVQIEEVLAGKAAGKIPVTWDASTFGEPEEMAAGPFLIALRDSKSPIPPLRGPSATIAPSPEPNVLTVLQAPCAAAFLFESTSEEASAVRRILAALRK